MTRLFPSLLIASALVGCSGLEARNSSDPVGSGSELLDSSNGTNGGGNGSEGGGSTSDLADFIPATTRFARLTHVQWENTVVELLGLTDGTGLSATFIGDTISAGFSNDADNLQVTPELVIDYQRAAEDLSRRVVNDPALYAHVVPQDPRAPSTTPLWTKSVNCATTTVYNTNGMCIGTHWIIFYWGQAWVVEELPKYGEYRVTTVVTGDTSSFPTVNLSVEINGEEIFHGHVPANTPTSIVHTQKLSDGNNQVLLGYRDSRNSSSTDINTTLRSVTFDLMPLPIGRRPGGDSGAAERDAWIEDFGSRAFRRPLTSDELDMYQDLFETGPDLVGSGDDFADGVRIVLQAMLQSPQFLYRIESTTEVDGEGRIALSGWELASKLSYSLWNGPPDEELVAKAASGALKDPVELRAQALRMLADPRAKEMIGDLHRQLLLLDSYANISATVDEFPDWRALIPGSMRAEALAFVDGVVFGGGSIHDLFTDNQTYINDDLAPIYGVGSVGSSNLVPVELDPTERAGLLTLSGFLALKGVGEQSSPIRRGAFINTELLCVNVPPPPPEFPGLPEIDGSMTTRQVVEAHTGEGTCGAGCHSTLINPPGFALEGFDGLGRSRIEEFGMPIDSSGTYTFSDGQRSWTDAVDFAYLMAESKQTHQCYTKHLLQYVHGRVASAGDGLTLSTLSEASVNDHASILEIIADLVSVDSFRFRSTEVP
jgi:hypothetical protein